MKCPDTIEMEAPPAPMGNQIKLPLGILGFEKIKDYVLLADPAEAPFAWLRVADNSDSVFLTLDGQTGVPMAVGDRVKIGRAAERLKLIQPPNKSYFEILRSKLKWGEA